MILCGFYIDSANGHLLNLFLIVFSTHCVLFSSFHVFLCELCEIIHYVLETQIINFFNIILCFSPDKFYHHQYGPGLQPIEDHGDPKSFTEQGEKGKEKDDQVIVR